MKQLYTELQEEGWKDEEIETIPSKLAWRMVASRKVKELVKGFKNMGVKIVKNWDIKNPS